MAAAWDPRREWWNVPGSWTTRWRKGEERKRREGREVCIIKLYMYICRYLGSKMEEGRNGEKRKREGGGRGGEGGEREREREGGREGEGGKEGGREGGREGRKVDGL